MVTMPERVDYERIERAWGPMPWDATDAEQAERYSLAQAARLIREHEVRKSNQRP